MPETIQNSYDFFSRPYSLLILAFILDLLIGDPGWLPHPVRGMGWAIARAEIVLRRIFKKREKAAGVFLVLLIAVPVYCLSYVVEYGLHSVASYFSLAVMVYLTATTIATKELIASVQKILSAVHNNIENARENLSRIVGRDTKQLKEKDVIKAAIESLAENASDGIIAPIFYFVVGGLPLAMTYKAINTMDSMVGYKNDRYKNFGWAAARLDDIANFIPARISGVLIVIAAFLLGIGRKTNPQPLTPNPLLSLTTMFRDGGRHPSPNSGMPEAAIAGALGVKLGGPSMYGGVLVEKPYIGEERTKDYLSASARAIGMVRIASLLGIIAAATVLYARFG